MTSAQIGLVAGMGMGLAAIVGGFPGFLLVAALGAIGLIVGKVVDGEVDLSSVNSRKGRDRS
ncbi:hypothetical protein EK0264_18010 [Epidermidibacterium keratini]|uniref:DUF2273 domain-containing protein n=1 Tax=Epidermidibacterium keratini TaxID=1891644 RepID=A0A7L4YSU9_9ACTN|nr:hypothetical protein [Epidermidibacterium keratini]QHC01984.1 hypothetical protein EK0264_18010 [Epidermidibacterium keratini]